MVLVGILATVASGFYSVTFTFGTGVCSFSYVDRGLPLAWSSSFELLGSPCLLLSYPLYNPSRGMLNFYLDVVFYVAAGLAIIQLYRGIRGKTITAQSSRVDRMI